MTGLKSHMTVESFEVRSQWEVPDLRGYKVLFLF